MTNKAEEREPLAKYLSHVYEFSTQEDSIKAMQMAKEIYESVMREQDAARAASPVSAPITLDQAREWRRINWYDSVPEMLDKALAAFANYAAKAVAPVSAEQPTLQNPAAAPSVASEDSATQPEIKQLAVDLCRELYDRFMMGGWEPQDAYEETVFRLQQWSETPRNLTSLTQNVNETSKVDVAVPSSNRIPGNGAGSILYVAPDFDAPMKLVNDAPQPGSEDWMRKAAEEYAPYVCEPPCSECREDLSKLITIIAKHYAASQLSTEKK